MVSAECRVQSAEFNTKINLLGIELDNPVISPSILIVPLHPP